LQTFQGGSDPVLKDLASRDVRVPADKEMAALGNDWLAYAKSKPDRSLVIFTERAFHWLVLAYVKADAQNKQMIKESLQQAVSFREGTGDVIALLDDVGRKIEKAQIRRSEQTLSAYDPEVQEISVDRGILVGFNFSLGRVDGKRIFQAVQPVYLTKSGTRLGEWSRAPEGELVEVRAPSGYAVNGLISQSDAYLDTLQLTFAQITPSGLDRVHRYHSQVINGPRRDTPSKEILVAGGRPVVGIVHHGDSKVLRGMGFVFAR
jgi:hypothetical protein